MRNQRRDPDAVARPRELRERTTDAEAKLWFRLRDRQLDGAKFRRQHALGPYVADFACLEQGLIIELDGGQHAERTEADATRTAYLSRLGFLVIRFWNPDVLADIEGVLETILHELKTPHPGPLTASGAREIDSARVPHG